MVTVIGLSRLSLDNRFIDYFRAGSEVREGLVYLDQNLGGTVPFEVVVRFTPYETPGTGDDDFGDDFAEDTGGDDFADDFASDDDFSDDFASDGEGDSSAGGDPFPERYWFTPTSLNDWTICTRASEAIPGVGKVLSLASLERVGRDFNDGKPLSSLLIVGVLGALPADIRELLIDPYANPETGEMRLSARMVESGPAVSKAALWRTSKPLLARQASVRTRRAPVA